MHFRRLFSLEYRLALCSNEDCCCWLNSLRNYKTNRLNPPFSSKTVRTVKQLARRKNLFWGSQSPLPVIQLRSKAHTHTQATWHVSPVQPQVHTHGVTWSLSSLALTHGVTCPLPSLRYTFKESCVPRPALGRHVWGHVFPAQPQVHNDGVTCSLLNFRAPSLHPSQEAVQVSLFIKT